MDLLCQSYNMDILYTHGLTRAQESPMAREIPAGHGAPVKRPEKTGLDDGAT